MNNDGSVSASFPSVGTATLVAKLDSDCGVVTDSLHISIIDVPVFDLGADVGYCADDPNIVLNMPDGYDIYSWSTGSSEQSITLNSPVEQTITAYGYYQGCYASDEIEILGELSGTIDLGPDVTLCDGQPITLDAGSGFDDYLWQDGSTEQTFTAYLGGLYSVSVSEPCAASDEIQIDECDQVIDGIDELGTEAAFLIYPNPAQDQITFDFNYGSNEVITIEIVNEIGSVVVSEQISVGYGENSTSISVEELASGTYAVMITSDDQFWRSKTFIIAR